MWHKKAMWKKITPISCKISYEEKCIWHTSQKFVISCIFSKEFSRCAKKDMRRKIPHILFLFKGIKHIIANMLYFPCVRSLVAL